MFFCHAIPTVYPFMPATQAIFVLAPQLHHSGPLFQCFLLFLANMRERLYEEGSFFTSMKVFALGIYTLNENIVLHKIPGFGAPISAIWVDLKINITANINLL